MNRASRRSRWVAWVQATVHLCLCIASAAAQQGFLSIDCGSVVSYKDSVTGINWVPDAGYISTGKNSQRLGNKHSTPDNATQLWDLRYFPENRNRNCYILPVNASATYLVRSMFQYAYFGKVFDILSFDLTLNSNFWTTVTYGGSPGAPSLDTTQTFEMLFRSDGMFVSICLARKQGTPFISSLELRKLDDTMYSPIVQTGKILLLEDRYNFGANADTGGFTKSVRYPDDPYDRIWVNFGSVLNPTSCPADSTNTTTLIPSLAGNRPPVKVMEDACVGNNSSISLSLQFPTTVQDYYAVLYVQEIDAIASATLVRGMLIETSTIRPTPVNVTSVVNQLNTAKSNLLNYMFNLTVTKAPWSALGPIVNAAEFYIETNVNNNDTATGDVTALVALRSGLNLTSWTGDPCYPISWDWVSCDYSIVPSRVTQVNLTDMGIVGFIAPAIANLTQLTDLWLDGNKLTGSIPNLNSLANLQSLRLQNNSLSGAFPGYLFQLGKLSELNVEGNNLSGSVPRCPKNSLLQYRCDGNPLLQCTAGIKYCAEAIAHSITVTILIIVGAFLGGVALVSIIMCVGCCYWRKRKRKRKRDAELKEATPALLPSKSKSKFQNWSGDQKDRAPSFTLEDTIAATGNFSKKIGEGSFGAVYYGKLATGQEVAVKMNAGNSRQGTAEFVNEVNLLSRVHHKNLVPLLGYCEESEEQMLIYAYMSNGTLRQHLYGDTKLAKSLKWISRLNILINAAKGLEYLHTGCNPRIIHRDVKSSNILLDDKMVAKVADFGLSKSGPEVGFTSGFSTVLKGTPGYFDPEYFVSQRLTLKSDVYGFGVVLLETVSGRAPYHSEIPDGTLRTLVEWMHLTLDNDIFAIVDPLLKDKYNPESMRQVIQLAATCVEQRGVNRPDMGHVVQCLISARDLESPLSNSYNNTGSSSPPSISSADTSSQSSSWQPPSSSQTSSAPNSYAYMSSDLSYKQGR